MLRYPIDTFSSYLYRIPHGEFQVETRPIVREERFDKYAKIPIARTILAFYFVAKDDAFLRPHKPDPAKPMFYRRYLWRVHNCGQRKDGTFYTSGNAVQIVYENGVEVVNTSRDKVTREELKAKYGSIIS
jgi:hypothetical protein